MLSVLTLRKGILTSLFTFFFSEVSKSLTGENLERHIPKWLY